MDAQAVVTHRPTSTSESLVLLAAPETKLLAPPRRDISETDFEEVVRGALEAVGGTLLFKMRINAEGQAHHAAAAAVGVGDGRQFLLLTLPTDGGGQLKVETAARSASPLARIAASYAGLMDVFKAAA
jgi:hypothetical protein